MNLNKHILKLFFNLTLYLLTSFLGFELMAQEEDTDFGTPGIVEEEVDKTCNLSSDNDLLSLLNFKLKKFDPNPKDRSEIGEAQMTPPEVSQATIRFYAEQLKDINPIKMQLETFMSLGGETLRSLISRSSKILLKHPEKCVFFSLYGDQIIGQYNMSFGKILSLYATAVNNDNQVAQEFIRTQLTPSKMTVDEALISLYDDYGYQQNVIESLLPEDVRVLFFGENQMLNIADVAESKLLAFSLLGGRIRENQEEIFVFAPESKKGLLGSNETIVVSGTGKIYEVPLLNIPLALNVLRSLGFNSKIIILKHVYISNKSYCKVGDAGIWYHFTDDVKQMGCDFLSNTIRSIKNKTLNMTNDYAQFRESINRVLEISK